MTQFSKDELSFAEEIPSHVEIECPICLSILVNPHLVSCCGHHFCEDCIKRVEASNGACPMCKKGEYQVVINKDRLRIINGLKVYCTNKENGCQWKGELKNLSTHLNKRKREGECQYEDVKCRYEKCEERNQRQHLKHHEDNDCLQRPFECQYCNEEGTYHSITEEHYKICLWYPVLCPNQCTHIRMPRGSVTDHVNNECPLQPVDCVFSWAGCKERPLRKDIKEHTTNTKHMMILAVACGELKKENDKIKQETALQFKEESDKIKTEMALQLQKENQKIQQVVGLYGELKKENDKIKEELGEVKEENKRMKANIHRAIAKDSYPTSPVAITRQSGIVHFYTDICGRHMSVKLLLSSRSSVLILAIHKDIFNSGVPRIYACYDDKVIPLTDGTEVNYKASQSALENVSRDGPLTHGVIREELPEIWSDFVDRNTITVNFLVTQ